MFEAELESLLCDLKAITGDKYIAVVKKREDTIGIDTTKAYQLYIQESKSVKDQTLKYDSRTKLYSIKKYYDIIIQYQGKKDTKLECKLLDYVVLNYGDTRYIDDRQYIFKAETGEDLKSDIQFFFINFALQINTLNKPCNW